MKSLNNNEMLWVASVEKLENREEYGCFTFRCFCLNTCFNICFTLCFG